MTPQYQNQVAELSAIEPTRVVAPLVSPHELRLALPVSHELDEFIQSSRVQIEKIVAGTDDRLLVVVGPCSVHDPVAAMEYARWLAPHCERFADSLCIVMRVYVEKPRTSVGWKGLINDPQLDGSFRINDGLQIARQLMLDITALGIPIATEFVDVATPAYLEDVLCWTAVGARTVESQAHREMASGLPFAVGFKNGTTGSVEAAVNAMIAAAASHRYIAPDQAGINSIVSTSGNSFGHVILRGGERTNYDRESVLSAASLLRQRGFAPHIMIDCGHGNSPNVAKGSLTAAHDVVDQIESGAWAIMGLMIESNLVEGRQNFPSASLTYGQSITDACIDLSDTLNVLGLLSQAQQQRAATSTHALPDLSAAHSA